MWVYLLQYAHDMLFGSLSRNFTGNCREFLSIIFLFIIIDPGLLCPMSMWLCNDLMRLFCCHVVSSDLMRLFWCFCSDLMKLFCCHVVSPAGLWAGGPPRPPQEPPGEGHVHPGVCPWWQWHLLHFWAGPNHSERGWLPSTQVGLWAGPYHCERGGTHWCPDRTRATALCKKTPLLIILL